MGRFAVHVHQLISTHRTGGELHPPLLTRLRDAAKPGNDGGKAGSSDSGKPIPIDATAIDLFCKIETRARKEWLHLRGFVYVGKLENLLWDLISPPFTELPEDWDLYLYDLATSWIDEILGLLNPTKPRRKLHSPCPACGVKYHGERRTPALTLNCWDENEDMVHPSKWDAACSACGAEWHGDEVQWLSRTLIAV
ncbi:hypothetical protein FBY30_2761 [Arthrobacter sp. SLBN-83]|uniref:hypothetical protein n=1 Tax=Arthrobacter sp. SLBN-83 TaxID=2768449 RepID=UPI001154DE6F|nr:hypothetical protein [Arthrobacter sp. SLBN-83]TQJ60493.1 hypothetical protein FBY30_2761 [Arthrobacter sp. SLBN-83]